jgi:hypothetical protein
MQKRVAGLVTVGVVIFILGGVLVFFFAGGNEIQQSKTTPEDLTEDSSQVETVDRSNRPTPDELYMIIDSDGGRRSQVGFINSQGEIWIPPTYYGASKFREDKACVYKGRKAGFINKKGNFIIQPQYRNCGYFQDGIVPVSKNGKWGLINEDGETVAGFDYDGLFGVGPMFAAAKGELYGFINEKGDFIVEPKYETINRFVNGFAPVRTDGKWGFVDSQGREVIKPQYKNYWFFGDKLGTVKKDGKWGAINRSNEVVVDFQYYYLGQFSNGLAPSQKNNGDLMGYLKQSGEVAIAPKFEWAGHFQNGVAPVREPDKKIGFINPAGEYVIDPYFDKVAWNYPAAEWGDFSRELIPGFIEAERKGQRGTNTRLVWVNRDDQIVWGPEGDLAPRWEKRLGLE